MNQHTSTMTALRQQRGPQKAGARVCAKGVPSSRVLKGQLSHVPCGVSPTLAVAWPLVLFPTPFPYHAQPGQAGHALVSCA